MKGAGGGPTSELVVERKAAEGMCACAAGMLDDARGCEGNTGHTSVVGSDLNNSRPCFALFDQAIVWYSAKQWGLKAGMALIMGGHRKWSGSCDTRAPIIKEPRYYPDQSNSPHAASLSDYDLGLDSHSKGSR